MREVDRLVWAASSTFRIGDLHLGVQSNEGWVDAFLRRHLGPHIVEDPEAPTRNYSVRIGVRRTHGEPAPLSVLFRGCTSVARSRSALAVVDAFAAHLDDHLVDGAPFLRLEAVAVVRDGQAVIAPSSLRYRDPALARRLAARGISLAPPLQVTVDPATARLVVRRPEVAWDRGAVVDELADLGCDVASAPIPPDTYPIVGWIVPSSLSPSQMPTRAEQLAALLRLTRGQRGISAALTLATLRRLVDVAPVVTMSEEPMTAIDRLLTGHPSVV